MWRPRLRHTFLDGYLVVSQWEEYLKISGWDSDYNSVNNLVVTCFFLFERVLSGDCHDLEV
jgi:hypothetical protein